MLHRIATATSQLLLAVAAVMLGVAVYQLATNSGKWANDYWFNPDWIPTATSGVLAAVAAVTVYLAGRLLRYWLKRA
jgi:hypothetical protein